MDIVLASLSKFRRQAIDLLNVDYDVIPSQVDEKSIRDKDPRILARKLAEEKAREVGTRLDGGKLVIAGDLFVVFEGEIFEKPTAEGEAVEMLRRFSGNEIDVVSGVAVFNTDSGGLESALGLSAITFRALTEGEIKDYVSEYPVLQFAGGFEKEGVLMFSSEVHGDLSFFTGFPLNKLVQLLRDINR
ncbi:septum formation protein Maf [Candidatus Bipolaricaulota bacterium]|nr:septum formation protein Maf [Candidatus Bipolaricaulota bacterium]